jgi:Topoisomerase DNA binding C4 zinc finger
MPNEQLNELMHALRWELISVIVLGSIGAFLLRELLQWIERRVTRAGHSSRARRDTRESTTNLNVDVSAAAPRCPSCDGLMVRRSARRGAHVGSEFWGCFGYPRCRGTRPV